MTEIDSPRGIARPAAGRAAVAGQPRRRPALRRDQHGARRQPAPRSTPRRRPTSRSSRSPPSPARRPARRSRRCGSARRPPAPVIWPRGAAPRSSPGDGCRSAPTSTRSRRATGGAGRSSRTSCFACGSRASARSIVYRSTAKGHSHPVESRLIDSDGPETVEIKLSLSQFIDGGWYWFDIAAASRGVTLDRGRLGDPDRPARAGPVQHRDDHVQPSGLLPGQPARARRGARRARPDRPRLRRRPGHPARRGPGRLRRRDQGPRRRSCGSSTRATSAAPAASRAAWTRPCARARATTSCCSTTTW